MTEAKVAFGAFIIADEETEIPKASLYLFVLSPSIMGI